MAGAWLCVCHDLLRTGARLRLCGVCPGRLSLGAAFSLSRIPLTQLRYRSDSTATSASIQNPKVVTTERVSEGDEGVANSPHQRSSLNDAEIAKFSAIADTWWDFEGPFKPLHLMNPTRVSFIRSALCRHFRKNPFSIRPFEGLKIIDVGCGGGILSEPLARMGACVTGIDAVEKNINVARIHAGWDPLTSSIEYICTTAGRTIGANWSRNGTKQRQLEQMGLLADWRLGITFWAPRRCPIAPQTGRLGARVLPANRESGAADWAPRRQNYPRRFQHEPGVI